MTNELYTIVGLSCLTVEFLYHIDKGRASRSHDEGCLNGVLKTQVSDPHIWQCYQANPFVGSRCLVKLHRTRASRMFHVEQRLRYTVDISIALIRCLLRIFNVYASIKAIYSVMLSFKRLCQVASETSNALETRCAAPTDRAPSITSFVVVRKACD